MYIKFRGVFTCGFWATVCKTVRPMLSDRSLSCPVCPILSVTLVYCDYTIAWIKMKLGVEVGFGPGHTVLNGEPAPPKRGHSPKFSTHVCCGQTAGWIKMPLGTEVGLGAGYIVLDGDPAPPPPPKGGTDPNFRHMPWGNFKGNEHARTCPTTLCSNVQYGWTDWDAVWVVDSGGPKEAYIRWSTHWRNLANTSEPSMCVSRRRREMYCGHSSLCACLFVCVCLSAAARTYYCTDADVTWVSGRDCPLLVHYWAHLQSVHRFRCCPQNPNFGARIGIFKPNLRNQKKLLHRFQPNFARW